MITLRTTNPLHSCRPTPPHLHRLAVAGSGPSCMVVSACICDGAGRCDDPHVVHDRWSYTVGRAAAGLPELVVFGLSPSVARAVLEHLHRCWAEAADGRNIYIGSSPFTTRPVPRAWLEHQPDRMAAWMRRCGPARRRDDLPGVVQVIWGDADEHFPDDPRCDPLVAEDQPVLSIDPFSAPCRGSRPTPAHSVPWSA